MTLAHRQCAKWFTAQITERTAIELKRKLVKVHSGRNLNQGLPECEIGTHPQCRYSLATLSANEPNECVVAFKLETCAGGMYWHVHGFFSMVITGAVKYVLVKCPSCFMMVTRVCAKSSLQRMRGCKGKRINKDLVSVLWHLTEWFVLETYLCWKPTQVAWAC